MKRKSSNSGITRKKADFIFYAIIILLAASLSLQADTQLPDWIVIKGDTLEMSSSPISDFIRFYRLRGMPKKVRALSHGFNCWRGYQALWELQNDSLFLRDMYRCNVEYGTFGDECIEELKMYGIPDTILVKLKNLKGIAFDGNTELQKELNRILGEKYRKQFKKLDLPTCCDSLYDSPQKVSLGKERLVKGKYRRNNYFAEKFTGELRIRTGKRISDYHMGFGTVYEEDLVIGISKGVAKNRFRVYTIYHQPDCENSRHFCESNFDLWLPDGYDGYGKYNCDSRQLRDLTNNFPAADARAYRTFYCDSLCKTNIECVSWRANNEKVRCDDYSFCAKHANVIIGGLGNEIHVDSLRYFKIFNKPDDHCIAYGCMTAGQMNGRNIGVIVLMNCDFRALLVVDSEIQDKMEFEKVMNRLLCGVNLHGSW